MSHHTDEIALTAEQKIAFKERKAVSMNWAVWQAQHLMRDSTLAENKVSRRACRAILLEYAKASPTGDFCNISQERLAERSGYSRSVVARATKAMRQDGLLFSIHRYKGEGINRKRVTSYTILSVFKRKIDALRAKAKRMSVAQLLSAMAAESISVTKTRLFNSLNKAASRFSVFDKNTGEVLDAMHGINRIGINAESVFRGLGGNCYV